MARKTVTASNERGNTQTAPPTRNRRPSPTRNLLRTIAELLADSDLTEFEMEKGDLRIRAARHAGRRRSRARSPLPRSAVARAAAVADAKARAAQPRPAEPGRIIPTR